MTPTEHAAVAEAIAALEPIANKADSGTVHGALRENGMLTVIAPNGFSFLLEAGAFSYARTAHASLRAIAPAPADDTFQSRVKPWMDACFGPEISSDMVERGDRHLEEVLELLQSGGYDLNRVAPITEYVANRPSGEPMQEVGGVMVTLAAYCLAAGLDMRAAAETELARVWTKIDKIRAKQAAKPKHSPLPAAPADQSDVPLWAHWSSASAMTDSNIDKQFKIIEIRRAELTTELKFRGRPPADQSDAGRDGVIEECAKIAQEEEAEQTQRAEDFKRGSGDHDNEQRARGGAESAMMIAASIRALASAPSETVGRGEDERKLIEDFRALMKSCEYVAPGNYEGTIYMTPLESERLKSLKSNEVPQLRSRHCFENIRVFGKSQENVCGISEFLFRRRAYGFSALTRLCKRSYSLSKVEAL